MTPKFVYKDFNKKDRLCYYSVDRFSRSTKKPIYIKVVIKYNEVPKKLITAYYIDKLHEKQLGAKPINPHPKL